MQPWQQHSPLEGQQRMRGKQQLTLSDCHAVRMVLAGRQEDRGDHPSHRHRDTGLQSVAVGNAECTHPACDYQHARPHDSSHPWTSQGLPATAAFPGQSTHGCVSLLHDPINITHTIHNTPAIYDSFCELLFQIVSLETKWYNPYSMISAPL